MVSGFRCWITVRTFICLFPETSSSWSSFNTIINVEIKLKRKNRKKKHLYLYKELIRARSNQIKTYGTSFIAGAFFLFLWFLGFLLWLDFVCAVLRCTVSLSLSDFKSIVPVAISKFDIFKAANLQFSNWIKMLLECGIISANIEIYSCDISSHLTN